MPAAYNPVGALGGLFAPAFIYGNPQSDAAVAAWGKANLKTPPLPVEVKPPVVTPTGSGVGTLTGRRMAGLDLASGLDASAQRDAIAAALIAQQQQAAAGGDPFTLRVNPFANQLATEVGGGG